MVSVYLAFGIICLIFWMLYYTCGGYEKMHSSRKKLVLYFMIARIFPMLVYGGRITSTWVCLLLELAIIAMVFMYFRMAADRERAGKAVVVYLFCPATMPVVICGNMYDMILLLLGVAAACICCHAAVGKKADMKRLLLDGLVTGTSLYGLLLLTVATNWNLTVLQTALMVAAFAAAADALYAARTGRNLFRYKKKSEADVLHEAVLDGNDTAESVGDEKLDRKDVLIMLIMTAVFAVLVLSFLGSSHVPETYMQMQSDKSDSGEIILDFGEKTEISEVSVFLGYKSKRIYDISCRESKTGKWKNIEIGHEIKSALTWNDIAINRKCTQIKLSLSEDDARINEVVCLDSRSNIVTPENSGSYPEIFDEQSYYPDIVTYYDGSMFDEVYHARTAYEFLHRLPVYENTHPPLGKTLISAGIAVFGMNPFGWRIVCAIAGILMIPLMYLWAHMMFRSRRAAIYATLLAGTMFMNLTLSRIATLDILVAFFVTGMFTTMYGFCRNRSSSGIKQQMCWLFVCGCFTALAVATKWTGIYAAVGIAVLFFVFLGHDMGGWKNWKAERKYLSVLACWCVLCFIVIPATVYLLSYIPFTRVYTDKNLLQTAISNSQLMLSYHSSAVLPHPYKSEWYEWLIDRRPLLDSFALLGDGKVSTVATFLNPFTCFAGLASLLHQFYLMRKKKDRIALYLVIAYCSVMIPWLMIYRTVFIYQYFLGGLLLPMMITNSLLHTKKPSKYMIISGAISAALFAMFYPVLTGTPVGTGYVDQLLEWFETWNFVL